MKETMLTATEVLDEARRIGAKTALQTFWKYVRLGLIPKGSKIRGHGNVSFYPPDTPQRLKEIQTLSKDLKLPALVRAVKLGAAVSFGYVPKSIGKLAKGRK